MLDYTLLRSETGREETITVSAPPSRTPYAMAFVQPQCWETVMCAEDALGNGTAFRSLVMPFRGKEGHR